ncbi:hypothetical protein H0H81_004866 [Sphagnurus paluster]|uniref:Novel STAND NTPase 1 domain-containing protein n=1 Tax=Sphagnurus paluster TaxID=117069 RepID=A0A9P7FUM9_9AGAR|nr:hypothetical protein H0H81_004866 [Sphagnurus paluster]
MGRQTTKQRPSQSGAVIFYGTVSPQSPDPAKRPETPADSLTPSASSTSSTDVSKSSSTLDIGSFSKNKKGHQLGDPAKILSPNDFSSILALAKDTALLFTNAPYIQVITGFIEQIIHIVDAVRTNKDRALELVDKVALYAGVIFDALNKSEIHDGDALGDLNVLECLYKNLESLSTSSFAARVSRIVQREEILSRLQEQDRRLDALITSFQLKSAIVLRTHPKRTEPLKVTNGRPQSEPVQQSRSPRPKKRLRGKPHIMFGRDAEIARIVDVVVHQKSTRIAILGPGGIGKTSLALSVLHSTAVVTKFQENRLFVSCEAATCADHIVGDLAISLGMKAEGCSGQLVDGVLDRLSQSPYLIVLDNFETPWEVAVARKEVEELLQYLADVENVSIVVTIRGSQHPPGVKWSQLLPPLQPIDSTSAVEIFTTISQKRDEYSLKLVQAVDCVPLAVTLLGNLAAVDGETTEALWHRWLEESVAMVESGDDRLSSLECSIEVSLSCPRMQRDPGALQLLSLLSLLPDGVSSETSRALESGVPGIPNPKKGIATLRQNALISADSYGAIRILSPIRLHICAHYPPSLEARRFVQDYFLDLARQGSIHHDSDVGKRLSLESANIEAMLVDALQNPLGRRTEETVEAVMAFCHHTYLFGVGSASAIALAYEKLACAPVPSSPSVLPATSKHVVQPHRFANLRFWKDPPKALPSPETRSTNANIKGDTPANGHNTFLKLQADCLGCWGQLLSRQLRFAEAQEKFQRAIELHVQVGDISGHAYDLHNLGCLLSRGSTTFAQAHTSFKEALVLHEGQGDQAGAAHDLMGTGQLMMQEMCYPEAQETFERALRLFVGCGDELGQALALNNIGHVVLCYSTPREAEGYFRRALEMNTRSEDVVGRAESLAGVACTLLLRSQFAMARESIEQAIALRAPAENPDHLHILGRVCVAEYRFKEAIDLFRRAQALHTIMDDKGGIAEDMRYLLQIRFYEGRMWEDLDEEDPNVYTIERCHLHPVEEAYSSEDRDELSQADMKCTIGTMRLQLGGLENSSIKYLPEAFSIHLEAKNMLGQASVYYAWGYQFLRSGILDLAKRYFTDALGLHEQVENMQSQADDYTKIAEVFLRQGLFQDALNGIILYALKLHVQISDVAGQGNDLYIMACVFLEQSRLDEAEDTVRKALEMHERTGVVLEQALDLATLSSILWQRYNDPQEMRLGIRIEAIKVLENAAKLFHRCVARGEFFQCRTKWYAMIAEEPYLKCFAVEPQGFF